MSSLKNSTNNIPELEEEDEDDPFSYGYKDIYKQALEELDRLKEVIDFYKDSYLETSILGNHCHKSLYRICMHLREV